MLLSDLASILIADSLEEVGLEVACGTAHAVLRSRRTLRMAIISFSLTKDEFLAGKKTVTRRDWSDAHFEMWLRLWDAGRHVHDAWDKIPRAGGKKIGELVLTTRPYRERLDKMPLSDLKAEGGMCSTLDEFCRLIQKSPQDYVTVVRFHKL
jgi:predicted transcriptional regulator